MKTHSNRSTGDPPTPGRGGRPARVVPPRATALAVATALALLAGCDSSGTDEPLDDDLDQGSVPDPVADPVPEPVADPVADEAPGMTPEQLRELIDGQVGGIGTLMVAAENEDLPQPLLESGEPDPFFETTEAKRYLGKMLFHDPIRTVRIAPDFGGLPETASTASCGSCHFGEAASKAGQAFNFAVGGEGTGYTTADGEFVVRRRPRTDLLPRLRDEPLFPGDALVDALPTLTDVYENGIGNPALGQLEGVGELLATGRLDGLDSVSRMAPSVVGFAYNNRLLLDGFAGEADESDGGLNPLGHPAQENLTLLLLDAHRMLSIDGPQGELTAPEALKAIPAYVALFRDAFPEEAAEADVEGDLSLLVNDVTVLRATSSYLRTAVTRNTPWDGFLAGDDGALSPAQRRGAELFFSDAADCAGGAGCYGCHAGPMLNKQVDDPDVAGVGALVEENFHNLGLADHPLIALGREARNDPTFRDLGRAEITGDESDAFEFRTPTLRQLRDGGNFMHDASFTNVADIVAYFNAGVPQDEEAGRTATPRFTSPRGEGSEPGLGLDDDDVAALTDFLENALHDEAFVELDPESSTDTLQLNERDLAYSSFRPELADLGAVDGLVLSGAAQDNDDPLSRRDQGLEFLDVTLELEATLEERREDGALRSDRVALANVGDRPIDTHLLVVVENLPEGVALANAEGLDGAGDPYVRLYLDGDGGTLPPGDSVVAELRFERPDGAPDGAEIDYALRLLSGQGTP